MLGEFLGKRGDRGKVTLWFNASLRIATWNLNRPPAKGIRVERLLAYIDRIDAEIWVLTETRNELSPGRMYSCVALSTAAVDRSAGESWTAIWVRGPIQAVQLSSANGQRTACARLTLSSGQPLLVYGSVLPWSGEEVFQAALREQSTEWCEMREREPATPFVLLGDLNQDLLPHRHYFGSNAGKAALRAAFAASRLTCLTGGTRDPLAQGSEQLASVNHICVGSAYGTAGSVITWPPIGQLRKSLLTDHYGVAADVVDL
jgi:endonuclease/exonuclease/phosphatase family metal-dependent hydrolase